MICAYRLALLFMMLAANAGQTLSNPGSSKLNITTPIHGKDIDPNSLMRLLGFELIVGFLLFASFLVGSLLMIRLMRRMRRIYLRPAPTPTTNADVWMMHKLPPDALDFDPMEGYC